MPLRNVAMPVWSRSPLLMMEPASNGPTTVATPATLGFLTSTSSISAEPNSSRLPSIRTFCSSVVSPLTVKKSLTVKLKSDEVSVTTRSFVLVRPDTFRLPRSAPIAVAKPTSMLSNSASLMVAKPTTLRLTVSMKVDDSSSIPAEAKVALSPCTFALAITLVALTVFSV